MTLPQALLRPEQGRVLRRLAPLPLGLWREARPGQWLGGQPVQLLPTVALELLQLRHQW